MDCYYLDRALSRDEVTEIDVQLRRFRRRGLSCPLIQFRIPYVLPVGGRYGGFSLDLPDYIRLFHRHFLHAGVVPGRGNPAAFVLPLRPTRLEGALALGLRGLSGVSPYIVVRDPTGAARPSIVDADDLLEWLAALHRGDAAEATP